MILHQVDNLEELPQVSQLVGEGMLLVGGLLEDISGLWRLELVEIAKDDDRQTSKGNIPHGDFSESQVQVVEQICADHRNFVDDDTFQVPEEQSLGSPLSL